MSELKKKRLDRNNVVNGGWDNLYAGYSISFGFWDSSLKTYCNGQVLFLIILFVIDYLLIIVLKFYI